MDVATSATIDNVRLGHLTGSTIDTLAGNLILRSANSGNNLIEVGTQFEVDQITRFHNNEDATSSTSGAVRIDGGLAVGHKIYAGNDIIAFNTSDISLKSGYIINFNNN